MGTSTRATKAPYWNSGAGMYPAREVVERNPPALPGWFGWRALYKGSWQAVLKTGEWTKGRWYQYIGIERGPHAGYRGNVRISEVRCAATCGGVRGKFVLSHIEEIRITDPVTGKTHWAVLTEEA